MAQSNAEQIKEAASQAVDERVQSQKGRVVQNLSSVASALRGTNRAASEVQPYIERAAQEVERVSGYLRDRSLSDILRDVEGFARREPALFLGGAIALGLVGGRFLKATSSGPGRQMKRSEEGGDEELGATSVERMPNRGESTEGAWSKDEGFQPGFGTEDDSEDRE